MLVKITKFDEEKKMLSEQKIKVLGIHNDMIYKNSTRSYQTTKLFTK